MLKEGCLGNVIPESLRRRIPLRVSSLDEFISLMQREQNTAVVGVLHKKYIGKNPISNILDKRNGLRRGVGRIGDFQYSGRFITYVNHRQIVYDEAYNTLFGSEWGTAENPQRQEIMLRTFLTVTERLNTISDRIPDAKIFVRHLNGRIQTPQTIQAFFREAELLGLSAFTERRE